MYEENIGKDRIDRSFLALGAKSGKFIHVERVKPVEPHEGQQHHQMQRIEAAEPQQHEPAQAKTFRQPLFVVRGNDEAAEYEEKINEEVGVPHQLNVVEMAVYGEMEQGDKAGAYTPPTVHHYKSLHSAQHPDCLMAGVEAEKARLTNHDDVPSTSCLIG